MSIKESGIYKILNIITKDFYEGSAVNLYNRWNRHRYELRKNIHGKNTYFQNAWNQYGEDNFEFSVLELCEKELLLVREQWYFDNDHPSYNINPVAGNCLGTKHTEESRAKISEAAKNRSPMSEEHKRKIGVAERCLVLTARLKLVQNFLGQVKVILMRLDINNQLKLS